MENKTKVETFIGFSIRARKCKIGLNAINTLKRANLILVCSTASDNTVKEAVKFSEKFHCKAIKITWKKLEDIVYKENAKIMAITDKALADAVIKSNDGNFVEL